MAHSLMSIVLGHERDLVTARQRTRQVAALLGFDAQDCTRLATAVSEVARNRVVGAIDRRGAIGGPATATAIWPGGDERPRRHVFARAGEQRL